MNARPAPHAQDAEPARRFLTDLDRRLGLSSASIATWPATVLFWKSQSTRLVRKLRDRHQGASTRVQDGTQRGQAG